MATAVIGGIIVSTVLSLVVVPAFYLIMDDLSRLIAWLFKGIVGEKDEDAPEPKPAELAHRIDGLAEDQQVLETRLGAVERYQGRGPKPDLAAE
jgi:uncharacterized protein involved in cysteine biosynthesis